jgi:glycine/D-amino acid oxidase-like deaminating enzyme
MKNQSYWLHTTPAFADSEQQPVEGHYDVAIIGGGLTGLSATLSLSAQGADVALLEAGRLVGEASGQNGGQCSTGIAQDFASMAAGIGLEKATRYYRAYADAVDTLRHLIITENIDCDYRESGKLKIAAKPQHADKLYKTYQLVQREVDSHVAFLDGTALREELHCDQFYAGFLQHNALQIHVGKLGNGMAEVAARHGAKIYQQAPVTQIKKQGDGYRLVSARGQLTAKQIVVATGISQHGPLGWFRRRIVPVGSFIIVTEQLDPALLQKLMPNKRSYVTSKIIGNYFRVIDDNRLLFGGRARFAMTNPASDALSGQILIQTMGEMFPELQGIKADYCWGGLVDITVNRLPRAGQHQGMYYAMGYSGHGVQMSVYMGKCMADMLGGNMQANPWRDQSWPAIPGYFGKPWFLPMVGAYYRFQDYLH